MALWHSTRIKGFLLKSGRSVALVDDCRYQVQFSYEAEDQAWDQFLAQTAGGHHVQTSLWGQAKRLSGWHTLRVCITANEQIIAGAQLLLRSFPLLGAIGYVQKGPVLAVDEPSLAPFLITQLQRVVKTHRIHYLLVQPPHNGAALESQLLQAGFTPNVTTNLPTATVLVDLTQSLETIQAGMRAKTRYNIRLGQRKGITVREGTTQDLATFHQILTVTGKRQTFSVLPLTHYAELERLFDPQGYFKLFLAEYQGEAVSAMLAIAFNDTVLFKRGGWSGRHGDRRPNEIMHWTAIQWAKAQGYRYYDLEGIDPVAARALIQGAPLPEDFNRSVTYFKLGFGGDVTLLPGVYEYINNPLLRRAYRRFYPLLTAWRKGKGR